MTVIRALKLVLDEHPSTGSDVLAQDVGPKWSNGLLLCFQFEINAERFAQYRQVFFSRQPRGEVTGLARPDIPEIDTGQSTENMFGSSHLL